MTTLILSVFLWIRACYYTGRYDQTYVVLKLSTALSEYIHDVTKQQQVGISGINLDNCLLRSGGVTHVTKTSHSRHSDAPSHALSKYVDVTIR